MKQKFTESKENEIPKIISYISKMEKDKNHLVTNNTAF